jgi:hypothetical protein
MRTGFELRKMMRAPTSVPLGKEVRLLRQRIGVQVVPLTVSPGVNTVAGAVIHDPPPLRES